MRLLHFLLAGLLASNIVLCDYGTTSGALQRAKNQAGNTRSVTKDLIIQGSLDQNWVEMIRPAPMSVNLLARLGLLASSAQDFALKKPKKGEYKLLYHPDSFKASLHQVTHTGWRAFQEAHSSMDEIAQRTSQIPGTLSNAVDIVVQGDADDINDILPVLLDEATSHIHECSKRASRTRDKFEAMSEIVAEILQGSLSTKAWSELEKSRLEMENKIKKEQKISLEEAVKRAKQQIKDTKKEVDNWRGKFETAYNSMPDGWDLLGLQVCESLANFVDSALKAVTLNLSEKGSQNQGNTNQGNKQTSSKEPSKFSVCVIDHQGGAGSKIQASNREFSTNERMGLAILKNMGNVFSKYKQSLANSGSPKDLTQNTNIGKSLNTLLEHVSEPFKSKDVNDDIKVPVLQLIKKVTKTAKQVSELQKSGKHNGKAKEYEKVMDKYINAATCLTTMAAEILKLPSVEIATPFDESAGSKSSGGIAEKHAENAEKELQMAEARLNKLEDDYEKKLNKEAKLTKSLQKVMDEITRLTADAKTQDAILDVLKKALVLLGDLEKQWKNLTLFFIAIEDRVRVSLKTKAESFVTRAQMVIKKGSLTNILGQFLYKALLEANAEVALVNRVSRKYVGISGEHIMPSINKAAAMITNTNISKKNRLMTQINSDLKRANKDLENLIVQEKKNFVRAIEARKKEISKIYTPLLMNVPAKVKAKITAAVKKGETSVATINTEKKSVLEKATENVMKTGKIQKWSTGGFGGLEF